MLLEAVCFARHFPKKFSLLENKGDSEVGGGREGVSTQLLSGVCGYLNASSAQWLLSDSTPFLWL